MKRILKKIIYIVFILTSAGLTQIVFADQPNKNIVMGYWENWGTYQNFPLSGNAAGNTNPVLDNQLKGLTALAYAFLEIAPNGAIQFSDVWSDLNPQNINDKTFCTQSPVSCNGFPQNSGLGNFNAFVNATVQHHVISVGGATHDNAWESAFNHPDEFVASLVKLVSVYKNIDWLDIDYEPVGGVPPQNIPGFTHLVSQIRQALPNLIISWATLANHNDIKNFGQENWKSFSQNINYISVMGYDMHGSFDKNNPYTALHSALFSVNDFSDDAAINALNAVGIPNEKIIMGMPLYGRAVSGVQTAGLGQVFAAAIKGDLDNSSCSTSLQSDNVCGGMIQYKTLVDQKYTAIPVNINQKLSGVYAYDANKKTFVSYDNPESATAKAQYAIDNKLAGVMFWALRFDKPVDDAQSVLAAVDKVYGITSREQIVKMKLQLTNNDPKNPVTITLIADGKYYAFPQLSAHGDVTYTDVNSWNIRTLLSSKNVSVLLTPVHGDQLKCNGALDFTNNVYHHIQVYYDSPVPNCMVN